ncbi:MAG: hypothetical protein AABX05_02435, partial [Nanoarchaeota archaeon]
ESAEQIQRFSNAFGLFHLAHGHDKNFYCAREAVSHVAGLLEMDYIEGGERYANGLSQGPLTVTEEQPNGNLNHHPCHLMHPGMYSASDLENLARELK